MGTLKKIGLLPRIIIAIALGILFSTFFPLNLIRFFVTVNDIFGSFLGFAIPLIILGLVAPGIAEMGEGAGKLLGITVALAYGSTLISGFFSYFTCEWIYPMILNPQAVDNTFLQNTATGINAFFTVPIPPLMDIMTALILAFVLGLGLTTIAGDKLKNILIEFKEVIIRLIDVVIIPFLPIYIFGIFLKMGAEGQVASIMSLFLKVIVVIFVMHILLLLFQFSVAGILNKRNPLNLLKTMLPAYLTALGTQSSAATIPVTLKQAKKLGVNAELAGFTVPLLATIHLAGSILKIVACAIAIMYITGAPVKFDVFSGFIVLLGIIMIAAPGVPGGAIMASLGLLQSVLGFDEVAQGLMIALYIAMDSFGTACNVTGDGAISMVVDRIYRKTYKI